MTDPFFAQSDDVKLRVSQFPMHYLGATWEDVPMAARPIRKHVQDWCEQWSGQNIFPERGLFLLGTPGIGKTLLAVLALKEVMLVKKRRGAFVTSADLISEAMNSMTPDRTTPEKTRFLDNCFEPAVRCLVLDDVAKEHRGVSEWAQHEIDRLIRRRYMQSSCTIVTTNQGIPWWGTVYGASTESFLHQAFDIHYMDGRDVRGR